MSGQVSYASLPLSKGCEREHEHGNSSTSLPTCPALPCAAKRGEGLVSRPRGVSSLAGRLVSFPFLVPGASAAATRCVYDGRV